MAFLKTVWESKLLKNYHNTSVANVITTPPTEVTGKTITFGNVGAVSVNEYTGTVNWETTTPSTIDLTMDQQKYFALQFEDIEKVQSAGELIDPHAKEASAQMNEAADSYVLGLYTGVHEDNVIGDDTNPKALDKTNVYDYIVDLGTKLNKKKVPKSDRFVIINSDVLGLLSKDDRFTKQPQILDNGVVEGQKINGMQVVVSEEVAEVSGKYKILALHKGAVGYGKQINKLESMRLESAFADGVRGLMVYGASVLKPEGVACLTATVS